ncbi:ureidoglycolate lyase [Acidisoma cellulosilytica]|uniref:Ureidoglycolate lyase n=1 Tax=Acidisoma cellulosilyticum TaxID=2802395 RepID=A0A963Z789_9PROT|nr:ureidoglycolate lyase [Acidisoma cellulosilyticum]MCB8884122.1 ureidoglycolate lyase [Acidisoma cellulosilyticum]
MTIHLTLEPITAEAFAPFGLLLPPPVLGGARLELIAELQNLRPSARARLSLATVAAQLLPMEAIEMERHIYSSQAFVPIDCASYMLLVALHGPDDMPDMATLRAFRVPGDTGINYKADTWHYPLSALERTARFTVLTFIDGTTADEQFVPVPQAVRISA